MTEDWTPAGLEGKSILITGASRGIGEAAARAFAGCGAKVALLARGAERIGALAEEIGGLAVPADVADPAAMQSAVDTVRERHGALDVLINNAGVIEPIGALETTDPDAWGKLIDINVKGVYNGIRAALPAMRAGAAGGTIINISSGAAHAPLEGWSAYCTSKAAVAMLTRAVHLETSGDGVRVMGLAPGTVATEMQARIRDSGINRISQLDWSEHSPPDWVGRVLLWMATDAADAYLGEEVSLRDPAIMARLGLGTA